MFTQLKPLLAKNSSLNLTLTEAEDGQITVLVVPKPKLTKDAETLKTPLLLTGTSEELDEQFPGLVSEYVTAQASLAEQLETTTAILDAAKKESQKKATKAVVSNAKPETKGTETTPAAKAAGGEDEPEDDDNADDATSQNVGDAQATSTTATAEPAVPAPDNLWA